MDEETATTGFHRAALIIAHPGHELRVHHWLELAAPLTFVLSDGSGSAGKSRLPSTTRVLAACGARPASLYGRFTDAALYEALLDRRFDVFQEIVEEFATAFRDEGIQTVVGDAVEGYNPVHDACRILINTAVALVNRTRERPMANFDFLLVGPPNECSASLRSQAVRIELDEAAFGRKLAAARAYAELAQELDSALGRNGDDAFRVEVLRPAALEFETRWQAAPFYERFGEQQAAAGKYARVLRYEEHLRPLEMECARLAAGTAAAPAA